MKRNLSCIVATGIALIYFTGCDDSSQPVEPDLEIVADGGAVDGLTEPPDTGAPQADVDQVEMGQLDSGLEADAEPDAQVPQTAPPWPFEFDITKAEKPQAIQDRLTYLGKGLPGLPLSDMQSIQSDEATIWLFKEMADLLQNAKASVGKPMLQWPQQPQMCGAHEAYVHQSLLAAGQSSSACTSANDQIAAAMDAVKTACRRIEFPEEYVLDHPPGQVELSTVTSLENLIALAGEALSHISIPDNILPADFVQVVRSAIAKIRYTKLIQAADDQLAAYAQAQSSAANMAACFDAQALAAFQADLISLSAELQTARQWLVDLRNAGLSQAAQEAAAVQQAGRARAALPFPALTDHERQTISMYIGGLYWRMRGQGLVDEPDGTQKTRLYYVFYPMGILAKLNGGPAVESVGLAHLLRVTEGWSAHMDMGWMPGDDKFFDLVGMTQRGKYQVGTSAKQPSKSWPPLVPLPPSSYGVLNQNGYDTQHLIAGGLQMGVCYWYAWLDLLDFKLADVMPLPYWAFIEGPTAVGEFCSGAVIALGLSKSLLKGFKQP